MQVTCITDDYGDTLSVSAYSKTVFLDAEQGDQYTEIALDVNAAKQLRKALERFVKEATL